MEGEGESRVRTTPPPHPQQFCAAITNPRGNKDETVREDCFGGYAQHRCGARVARTDVHDERSCAPAHLARRYGAVADVEVRTGAARFRGTETDGLSRT